MASYASICHVFGVLSNATVTELIASLVQQVHDCMLQLTGHPSFVSCSHWK